MKAAGVRREEANQRVRDWQNDAKLRGATTREALLAAVARAQSEFIWRAWSCAR